GGTECLVVESEVLHVDPGFWNACAPACLKNINWSIRVGLGHPPPQRASTQPFILEKPKTVEVLITSNLAARIPVESFGKIQPERTAGGGIEVPLHNFANPCIQRIA